MGYPSKMPDLQKLLRKIPQNKLVPIPVIKGVEEFEENYKTDKRLKFRQSRDIVRLFILADDYLDDFNRLVTEFNEIFGLKYNEKDHHKYILVTGDTEKAVYQPLPPLLKLKHFKKSYVDAICNMFMLEIKCSLIPGVKRILKDFKNQERWIKNALEAIMRSESDHGMGYISSELGSLQTKDVLLKALPGLRNIILSVENIELFMEQNLLIFLDTYRKPYVLRLRDEL